MSDLVPLFPRRSVPALRVNLVGGGQFDLASEKPTNFTLLVFYRGLHCPICKMQLKDLESKLDDFEQRGVSVGALSTDDKARAEQSVQTWGLSRLRVGYGVSLDAARQWGLYVSSGHGKTSAGIGEPTLFSEPAIYLVRPDGTLYFGSVQTMPFARPNFADILTAIDFVVKNKYPARGEVADLRKSV